MHTHRMTPSSHRFILALLSALYLAGFCYAIYDPTATTTKSPKRRESVLPWYLNENGEPLPPEEPEPPRSPKWETDPGKSPGKPIIRNSNTKSWSSWKKIPGSDIEQRAEITYDHTKRIDYGNVEDSALEFGQFEQTENQGFPHKSNDANETQKEGDYVNTGGADDKRDRDFYEDLADDGAKPHREPVVLSWKPKSTIAKYEPELGIQCPEFDSTGQFVYPLDCKFFVNCWNGRAFVQPCAPGTLFNPETLECDFPHKVNCFGEDNLGVPSKYVDASLMQFSQTHTNKESLEAALKCPSHLTGMLSHPTDCTKYLQCANGGTFIRDCGPGTVFNPAISVCDWPHNVKGCEGTFKTEEETVLTPPDPFGAQKKSEYNESHKPKIECPPDYTGMLPHPETCKKFLQCANGGTFVMDCGPGTAFNPLTSVCDWPYNVPGCSNDKPALKMTTTAKPWTPRATTLNPWSMFHRYNHTSQPTQPYWSHSSTTSAPNVDWDSRWRPTWKPTWIASTWSTARPYLSTQHDHSNHQHQGPGYQPDGSNVSNYPPYHGSAVTPDRRYDGPPTAGANWPGHGHHHGHHVGHGHHFGHGHAHHNHHSPPQSWDYPVYTDPGEIDTRKPQAPYDQTEEQETSNGGYKAGPQNPWLRNGTQFHEGTWRPEHGYGGNRQGYGRIAPGFFRPEHNQPPLPHGNVHPDNSGLRVNGSSSWHNMTVVILPNGNRTIWRQPEGAWNQQETQPPIVQQPPPNQNWNQESAAPWESKFHEWNLRTNVHQQNTADREADAKFDQWASKTNIFLNTKGHSHPETKNNSPKTLYPNGIYVNINGTRGHFITKEIEINQGHSKTQTYGSNDSVDKQSNKESEQGTWATSDSQLNRFKPIVKPSVSLEPPYTETQPLLFNFTGYFHSGHQSPKYPSKASQTAGDLLGSGSDNHRVTATPSRVLQPPFPGPSSPPPRVWHNSNYYPRPLVIIHPPYPGYPYPSVESPHPNKPATDLQPPFPDYSNEGTDKHRPSKPVTHLQQPFSKYPDCTSDNPNCNQHTKANHPNVPSIVLEPPLRGNRPDLKNSTNAPKLNENQQNRPAIELQPPDADPFDQTNIAQVPATNLQPPVLEPIEYTTVSPSTTSTERMPDKHLPTRRDHVQGPKRRSSNVTTTTDSSVPVVTTEHEIESKEKEPLEFPDVVEPELDYDVDVRDDKGDWKPVLVFENKSQTTTTESPVIMKITKKKVDVEMFNIEAAPFADEEPPFPVYYVPPVQPLTHSEQAAPPTPISGQVIRLRGGFGPRDGYVEVQGSNPGWGVVCDERNSWTLKEAHVVCRQLGYSRGAEMAWQGRNTKKGVPNWIAANSVVCNGTEAKFQLCKFTHEPECRVERDAIGVRCVPNPVAHCRKDEVPHEGQCYHLADPESGLNHAEALQYCTKRSARLLDIVSQQENDFISEWLLQLRPDIDSIMTSGVGFTTLGRTMWIWEDSARAKFRFVKWWPGWMADKQVPPWVGARPACIVMKRKYPCHERPDSVCVADYFFWDTEDCAASMKGHSYICKRPYDDIGCIYGKGNLYVGKANVTASGKDCLSWADQKVAHPLLVNVVSREVREKLKTHNYCRNPNPNKESRPWCFTGGGGEREYCDIPPCGNIASSKKSLLTGQCKPRHFECLPGECIPSPWVCDGEADCTNGADERACTAHLDLFKKSARQKLEGHDVEKWLNTPLRTCALRCKEADFTCRSFSHKSSGNICLLSDSNVGMTGALKPNKEFDYYEMKERSLNCDGMYICRNRKCINQTEVCNGKNDCHDRSDEDICTVKNLDYAIRLAGSNNSYEGRVEVKILGVWGQVCDDGFGMIDADVICKELGFTLGALEVRPGGFYGNLDPPNRFMVDQLKCRGNESSLRECDFDGWGVHNCQPEEAVGVVCKTAVDTCPEGHWKCDNSPVCIPLPFICDEVVDCPDKSDESSEHCDAPFEIRLANGSSPLQGRIEVRHHGIWGTVCDDDFSNATAAVICRSLGYGGVAVARKDGYFGPGQGPIWLDEVFCHGNETQLYRCEHNHWGQHNCDHNEDAGVICTPGNVNAELGWESVLEVPEINVNDLLPANCGQRPKDFNEDEDLIFAKVVHGSIAAKGTYPWQASIRVRGHSRSSHWCGAVILSPLHVLTAAHCLEGYNKGTYFVRAGDYNTEIHEGTEVEANIEDYYIHEDFRKGHRMNNDIALVLLKGRGIPLGRHIMPICLPSENTEYPAGLNCTISGFGSIETGKSTHSKDLRYGWIPLLDQSVCRADYIYGTGAISDGMVCAGYLEEGVDTCDGDSGGPLACYHNGAFTLYGITSWGQHCGKANKPGVYVRVAHYRRWIDRKLKESLTGR